MTAIILSAIGAAVAFGNIAAFTLMGASHAKERHYLLNIILSNSPMDFAIRQRATDGQRDKKAQPDPPKVPIPDGL